MLDATGTILAVNDAWVRFAQENGALFMPRSARAPTTWMYADAPRLKVRDAALLFPVNRSGNLRTQRNSRSSIRVTLLMWNAGLICAPHTGLWTAGR